MKAFPNVTSEVAHKNLEPAIERRQSARRAEANLFDFLENAPIGIHWVNADGIIEWANQAELDMLGYPAEEYIGRPIADFHVDASVIADILGRLKNGETLTNYEARLRHKDGSVRYVAINSNVLWEDGKFIHTRCFTRDITERKHLEEQSRAQLDELESIYRTAPIGLALIDTELRFARVNERLAEINGIPAEQHIGRTLRDVVPDLAQQAEAIFHRVLLTGEAVLNVELEGETRARPGVRRTWNENWYPLKDASGATIAVNVAVEEITGRKRSEAIVAESARIKHTLFELADQLHNATSLDDAYAAALQAITTALRCSRASILLFDESGIMRFVAWRGLSTSYRQAVEGHSPWARDDNNPPPICIEDIDQADLSESLKNTVRIEGIRALTFIPLVADGKLIGKFMAYFDTPRAFSNDDINLSLTIARQLAFGIEHLRAEQALRNNERRFRQIIDALPAAIYTTDAAGRLTHYNAAAVDFSGRVPELGTDLWCVSWKLYSADGMPLPHDQCPMAVSLKEGRLIRGVEAIAERPDGVRRWFVPYPTPLHDESGQMVGGINMLVDITERKEAEQAQAHLAAIVASSSDAILSKTLRGIITTWNASAERIFGYTADEMIGQSILRLIPPDRQYEEDQILARLKAGERIEHYETVRQRKDGQHIDVALTISPIADRHGTIIGASKIVRDITERKRAEQALRESEQRFQLAALATNDAIWDWDLKTNRIWWNEGAQTLFGYAPEQVGSNVSWWHENLHPDDRDRVIAGLHAVIDDSAAFWREEYRFRRADGSDVFVFDRGYVIRDEAGKALRMIGAIQDLTERKRAEELLLKHTRQLALITDAAPVFIAHCDAESRFKFVNKAYAQRFDLRPEECIGKSLAEIVGQAAHQAFSKYINTVLRGEPVEFDLTVPYAVIGDRFMHCSYAPELDADGKVIGFVAALVDITERKRIEEALRSSEETLKEADRRKDEFLAMLAHELRNPLAPIANAVHLLRHERSENPTQLEARAIIERQTARLARLVDDLLEVSRITTGRIRLHMEQVEISGIVERAAETVRPLVEQHRHTLSISLPPNPIWLSADAARMEQVLVNLLNNAAKYTDDGGRIELTAQAEGNDVVLRVRDTGIGIPPDLLPRVFDLFTQSERSLDRSHGGLGIGLSVVQRLVSMHGGTVTAKSIVGEGSEFTVRLPAARPVLTHRQAPLHQTDDRTVRPLRVLVVDDNVDAAQSLAMLLEVSGHVAWLAHDGLAALEAASSYRPHVVLLDIGLPKLDGYAVAARLRNDPLHRDALLVAMTGYGQAADRERGREAGFDHHLVKPVDFANVEQVLTEASKKLPH